MVRIGGAAVSWRSKLQPFVTLSTTKAEYIAAVEASKEVKVFRSLFWEMGRPVTGPSTLLIDNQSATSTLLLVVPLVGKGLDDGAAVQGLFEHEGGVEHSVSGRAQMSAMENSSSSNSARP